MMTKCGDGVGRTQMAILPLDSGAIPTSPHQFRVREMNPEIALRLNALWHSKLPYCNLRGYNDYKICYGFYFGGEVLATAIWTRPIARKLNGRGWLELRRYAIRKESPKNTASWGLSIMAKLIHKKHPEIVKLISYQDTEVHKGTIYKASNWKIGRVSKVSATGWNNRKRSKMQTTADKIRWEYDLGDVRNAPHT